MKDYAVSKKTLMKETEEDTNEQQEDQTSQSWRKSALNIYWKYWSRILGDGEGPGSLAWCSPWCHGGLYTTERVNNNMSWWQIKKVVILKCLLLQQQWTISWPDGDMQQEVDFTTGDDQFSGWTEKLQSTSQSQTCTKKISWSLFVGLLPIWFTIAFWIPAKPLHLRSMLSKLMRCTKTCNACS